MSSMPTAHQITDLFRTLRAFAAPDTTKKPPWPCMLDDLERRLIRAVNRDAAGTTTIDGYPGTTMSDGRGGSGQPIDPNDPTLGSVTLTSVEAAAARQAEADKIREHTEQAVASLFEAAGHLAVIERRLDLIDKISTPTPAHETAGTGYCEACGAHCSGAGDDRLRAGFCNPCRMAWDRAGRPDRATFKRERRHVPTDIRRSG